MADPPKTVMATQGLLATVLRRVRMLDVIASLVEALSANVKQNVQINIWPAGTVYRPVCPMLNPVVPIKLIESRVAPGPGTRNVIVPAFLPSLPAVTTMVLLTRK